MRSCYANARHRDIGKRRHITQGDEEEEEEAGCAPPASVSEHIADLLSLLRNNSADLQTYSRIASNVQPQASLMFQLPACRQVVEYGPG